MVNLGLLQGEQIHLIGNNIDNQGKIDAPGGYVTISCGKTVMIGEKNGHCFVAIDPEMKENGIGASDLIGLAITNKGTIIAKDVQIEANTLEIQGKIDVSGDLGGYVQILGDQIALKTLDIDATGQLGGGTVLVGGDYQGEGSLRKSKQTWMAEDARIDVSALKFGDGGKAILWSDGSTLFDGTILARGGTDSGSGGLIETSGKVALGSNKGRVDALAPKGRAGDWLLDPNTITIIGGGGGTLVQAADCADMVTLLSIDPGTINVAAANVLLCASTTITQHATATINIAAAGVGITFQSGGNTTLNDNTTTNGGFITFSNTPVTNVVLGTNVSLTSGGGNITFNGTVTGPTFTLNLNNAGTGTIDIVGAVSLLGLTTPAGAYNISLEGGGTITNATTFNTTTNVFFGNSISLPTLTFLDGVTTQLTSTTNVAGTVAASGGSSMTLGAVLVETNGATLQVGTGPMNTQSIDMTTAFADLTLLSSGGSITTVDINGGGSNTLTINAGTTGVVQINGNTNVDTIDVLNSFSTLFGGTTMATTVNLTNSTSFIEFGNDVTFTTINVTAQPYKVIFENGGTITNAATFTNTGGVQFGDNAGANITFTGGVNTNQPGVTTSTFGTVNTSGTPMTLGPVVLLGNTTMNTTNGVLTFNSTLTGAHNLTVNTGSTAPLFVGAVSIGDTMGNISLTINTTGANTIFQNTLTTVGGLTSTDNLVFNNNVSIGGVITIPSLTTNLVPLANYNVAFLGGGTVTAFTSFTNVGTVTFGGPTFPTLTFTNGVTTGNGPSMTFVQGTVNVTTAGATMTFGPTTFNAGNSFLTTNNGVMTIGNTTLTGNATLQTGGANLTMGNVSGPGNLTTSSGATGNTTIASLNCNTFTPSNSLTVTITGTTTAATVNLTGMAGGQAVTFNGLVNISTALLTSAAAYSVTFNAGGTVTPFTNFHNTGGVNFGNSPASAITFTNGVDTFFPGVVTNLFGLLQAISGPITLGTLNLVGNSTIQNSANPITFQSTINGNFGLIVNDPGGVVTFNGIVGGVIPLNSLDVFAGGIDIEANQSVQGGPLIYNGPVVLSANTLLTDTGSQGVSFLNTVDGAFSLTINAPNTSVFGAAALGGITPLALLTVTAGGTTTFLGNITTSGAAGNNAGNITITSGSTVTCAGTLSAIGGGSVGSNGFNGGNVSITSTGDSISVNNIDASGGSGGGFTGGKSGTIILQPASGFSSGNLGDLPQGKLELLGTLTALGGSGAPNGTSGTVFLSPAGRSTIMSVATIFGSPSGSNLTIDAGNLTIGQNEALTVLGNINFNIQNTAAVGDIVALDNLTITANTLDLELHQPGLILDYRGILYTDREMHLISRNTSVNASTIIETGSGPGPKIATINISESFFRTLLLFGDIVLNFDGNIPVSGIISWVLPADTTWDTTPLPQEQISWRQILAFRIGRTISFLPNMRGKWVWIEERTNGVNPIDEVLARYFAMKGHQEEVVSLPDFALYLREKGNSKANAFIANIVTLMREAKREIRTPEPGFMDSWGRFFLMKTEKQPKEQKLLSGSASYYFNQDVQEYTKPQGLTIEQWRQLLGQ